MASDLPSIDQTVNAARDLAVNGANYFNFEQCNMCTCGLYVDL
jgi:hypothetical protein